MIIGLISVLFMLSLILIMIDKNSKEINLVPVKANNKDMITEKLSNADSDELKRLGLM